MRFTKRPELAGAHARLSASKYSWLRYSDEKFDDYILASFAAARGTELHDLAAKMIKLGIPLERTNQTLNLYVTDALGFGMSPEVTLFYSYNVFGTADAIGYRQEMTEEGPRMVLRIHDLKTGVGRTSVNQLEIYAALFCLEYKVKPRDIDIELRIYQNDRVQVYIPDVSEIQGIMDQIKRFDKRIEELREEAQA